MFLVPVADERVDARRAEPASEGGDIAGAEMLVAEHQHRMLGKGLLDPGESFVIELRQVDAERLGAERFAERAQLRCGHGCFSAVDLSPSLRGSPRQV